MTDNNGATHDAWIIGEHELPLESPADLNLDSRPPGDVLVRARRRNGKWVVLARDDFDVQYEWVGGWAP